MSLEEDFDENDVLNVDVIVPTHNRSAKLRRALLSVLGQSYSNWTCWVVDDASTDKTSEVVESLRGPFGGKLRYLSLSKNMGVSYARNFALRLGRAPLVAFLDSDDEWHKEKLEKQCKYFATHVATQWLHCDEIWIRDGKRVNPAKRHIKTGGDVFNRSLELCCVSPSAVMLRRDFLLESGGFRSDYVVCEDYRLWLELAAREEIAYIDECLVTKYGGHADQLSRRFHSMDLYRIKALSEVLKLVQFDEVRRVALLRVYKKKLDILRKGSVKNSNFRQIEFLSKMELSEDVRL